MHGAAHAQVSHQTPRTRGRWDDLGGAALHGVASRSGCMLICSVDIEQTEQLFCTS